MFLLALSLAWSTPVEYPLNRVSETVQVVPLQDHVMVITTDRSAPGGTGWTFRQLDSDLEQLHEASVVLPGRARMVGASAQDDHGLVVVTQTGAKKLEVYQLAAGGTLSAPVPLRLPRSVAVEDIEVDGNDLWIATQVGKRGVLLHHDIDAQVTSVLLDETRALISPIVPTNEGLQVTVVDWKEGGAEIWGLEDGQITWRQPIEAIAPRTAVISAQRVSTERSGEIVVGTYGTGRKWTFGAQGLYVSRLADGQPLWEQQHSFTSFDDFFSYLPERRQARVERKVRRREEEGKDLRLAYKLYVHDAIERQDEVVLLAEAYRPIYRQYTTTSTQTVEGRTTTTTTTHTVFVGWSSTHAIVAGLTDDGSLAWNHTFPLDSGVMGDIRPQVHAGLQEDGDVLLVTAHDGTVFERRVHEQELIETEQEVRDATRRSADDQGGALPWAADRWLAWGVRRTDADEDGRAALWLQPLSAE